MNLERIFFSGLSLSLFLFFRLKGGGREVSFILPPSIISFGKLNQGKSDMEEPPATRQAILPNLVN